MFCIDYTHIYSVTDDILSVIEAVSSVINNRDDKNGKISFSDFITILQNQEKTLIEKPFEGPDQKVFEFLRILEEYRIKCEDEGNYLEASKANKQLEILKKQEEKRQQKAIRARQLIERQDIQVAHSMQYHEFNRSWDLYLQNFDNMAQKYIQQMTERHATILLEFQSKLSEELAKKPPKWSKELIEQRRQQMINAKSRNYLEAQRLKLECDKIEEREKIENEESTSLIFARREALFRQHQQAELQALLKRIECRRKEHIKQRNLDCKRLLQRNRNVQAVLESKQNLECQTKFEDIKKSLHSSFILAMFNNASMKQQKERQFNSKTSQSTNPAMTSENFEEKSNEEDIKYFDSNKESYQVDESYNNENRVDMIYDDPEYNDISADMEQKFLQAQEEFQSSVNNLSSDMKVVNGMTME